MDINPQGFVDAIVREMSMTDLDRKAQKVVIAEFDNRIDVTVSRLEAKLQDNVATIKRLEQEDSVGNAKEIARLRKRNDGIQDRIDYYES